MKFQAEIDLVEALKASIKNQYNRNYIRIFEEVSLGYGIADIVISDLKPQLSDDTEAFVSLDLIDINLFSLIQKSCGLSLSDLVTATRCSRTSIKRSLVKLSDCGYIESDVDIFTATKPYELPFRSNFAIEAKLKDWKRALKQAYRYRWFAEYAFVVLDDYHTKAALKNIDFFVKYNVGLASITTDGVLQRHFSPKRQVPFDPAMQILFSEQVKKSAIG